MLRALGFAGSKPSEEEKRDKIITQALQLENALKAMDYVLDDRATEAFKLLKGHENVAISQLAYGVVLFLEATFGFETETMKKASEALSAAENLTWKEKSYFEKNKINTSSIYPPGTEFAVAYAESNLLNALLMLLSENFMEGAKALLKLRRAYQTLDSISKNLHTPHNASSASLADLENYSQVSLNGSDSSSLNFVDVPLPLSEQLNKDKSCIDKLEKIYQMRKSRIGGSHIGNPPVASSLRSSLGFDKNNSKDEIQEMKFGNPDVSSVDEYIHSGVNLCFGILQVVLSLIPPAIGKVLSVVGFKGSREAGLQMVWNAAQERNIHGGIGLLALLVFYDGPFQFTDVDFDVPSAKELEQNNNKSNVEIKTFNDGTASLQKLKTNTELIEEKINLERMATLGQGQPTLLHPGEKLVNVLLHARALFPHSNLWLLQESRMLASRGRLDEAVEMMDTSEPSQMRQVDAMLGYDRSMILVFMHHFDRAAKDFLNLCKINTYSHALYTWLSAACYLEAYRMCCANLIPKDSDVNINKKDEYAKLAEKYIHEANKLVGKKKFLSKIPPFEKFIARKYKEIQSVHNENKSLRFIDCVGTSLVHELAYFYNGYNRMSQEHLELALKLLGYSATNDGSDTTESNLSSSLSTSEHTSLSSKLNTLSLKNEANKSFSLIQESTNQKLIRLSLQSLALRRLGQIQKGQDILDNYVIPIIRKSKMNDDPWLYPTVLYERALFCWKLNGVSGLAECMEWLTEAQTYHKDDYELSTRVSMKIKAAIDRLDDLNFE
ncbi:hypothetical protein DAMA08_005140 [Martiniozyma asiatica (nom. inval.)]|nr:hypothetical protein DAMA08_005140 [Martiniozyma asiatica]